MEICFQNNWLKLNTIELYLQISEIIQNNTRNELATRHVNK